MQNSFSHLDPIWNRGTRELGNGTALNGDNGHPRPYHIRVGERKGSREHIMWVQIVCSRTLPEWKLHPSLFLWPTSNLTICYISFNPSVEGTEKRRIPWQSCFFDLYLHPFPLIMITDGRWTVLFFVRGEGDEKWQNNSANFVNLKGQKR